MLILKRLLKSLQEDWRLMTVEVHIPERENRRFEPSRREINRRKGKRNRPNRGKNRGR